MSYLKLLIENSKDSSLLGVLELVSCHLKKILYIEESCGSLSTYQYHLIRRLLLGVDPVNVQDTAELKKVI